MLGDLGNKKGGGRGWLTHSREEIQWDKVGGTHFSDAMVTASDKRRGISEKRVLRASEAVSNSFHRDFILIVLKCSIDIIYFN